jgi:tetratricopeptide (TPR) repeat protein
MRRLLLTAVLCGWCGGDAAAQSDQAASHRRAGSAAFDVGDYEVAVREYQAAYKLDQDPRVLYNLGLAYRKKHQLSGERSDLIRARDSFAHFISLASPDDPRYAADREWLEKVRVLARAYQEEIERELAAAPEPEPAPVVGSPPLTRSRRVALTLFAAGGAVVLGAAVTGTLAWKSAGDADDLAERGDYAGANDAADRSDSLALTADILAAVGVVTLGAGLVVWLRRPRDAVTIAPAPGGVALRVQF